MSAFSNQSPCPGRDYEEKPKSYVSAAEGKEIKGYSGQGQEVRNGSVGGGPSPSFGAGAAAGPAPGYGATVDKQYNPYGVGQQTIDRRMVGGGATTTTPIGGGSTREFLSSSWRDMPSSKRKTLSGLITMTPANYEAFIELVAFHMLDNPADFGDLVGGAMVQLLEKTAEGL